MEKENLITNPFDGIEDVEDEEVIVLVNEETGAETEFSLLAMLEVDGVTYAYLEPLEEIDDFEEGDILINRVEFDENGEESYLPIESDEEIDRAFDAFDRMYVERYNMHCDGTPADEE